jgi:mannose-6-phosphate isomerase
MSAPARDPARDLRAQALALVALWAERGLDRERGGCWNRLDAGLAPVDEPHKRLLVQARQLWAFSEAVRLGAGAWAQDAAHHAHAFLRAHLRDPRRGGYWLTTARGGEPADRRKQLYAHAFVVLGLSHYARAVGAGEALGEAHAVLELLRAHLAAPGGGWFECAGPDWTPLPGPRLQNPHMHLLEALLALDEAGSDPAARAMADAIFGLCADRFVDRAQGCLGEVFTPALEPVVRGDGRLVEPGHHFEWVWLLHAYARARSSDEATGLAGMLHGFARRHGVDADGLVFDALERSGRVARDSKRLWPQTEHLKALAARGEAGPLCETLARVSAAYVDPLTGAWREQLDRAGRLTSQAFNATSVYHVVLALREAAQALEASGQFSSR